MLKIAAEHLFQVFSMAAFLFPIVAVIIALLLLRRMTTALEEIRGELRQLRIERGKEETKAENKEPGPTGDGDGSAT
ncbi:hypothetical protein [Staphylospora marina]|uniref:hypothetical protein n=1 Tax=Staphylospora marina TaxID=2490858 RepID=UPI000F5C28E1|nr:hypothetical protein [Staphylospora marina]